ncbi:MAG TPA: DUF2071 domain-containing protein [Myxococcaceae bacterium]|nr:DUF2071 domain-containing protein [Myxococcaceae bacterium]
MARTGEFLTAEWRWLAMANYRVEPALLFPRVPPGLELDLFDGTALMSLVGFRFLRTRLLGLAVPFHRDFDEVNLRFYVRRRLEDGWRRGVVFVRELVPRRALAAVARLAYGEPYSAVRMDHTVDAEGRSVEYRWRWSGQWCSLGLETAPAWTTPEAGSEMAFITEHYWGYSGGAARPTREYEVQHPPWRVRTAATVRTTGNLAEIYGQDLGAALSGPPRSAFLAEGSAVTVHRPSRL